MHYLRRKKRWRIYSVCVHRSAYHQWHFFLRMKYCRRRKEKQGKNTRQRKSSSIGIDFCGSLFLTAFLCLLRPSCVSTSAKFSTNNDSSYSTNKDGPQYTRRTTAAYDVIPFTRGISIPHDCRTVRITHHRPIQSQWHGNAMIFACAPHISIDPQCGPQAEC